MTLAPASAPSAGVGTAWATCSRVRVLPFASVQVNPVSSDFAVAALFFALCQGSGHPCTVGYPHLWIA